MKYCRNCGQINDNDNNFCIRCGIDIKEQIVINNQENPNDSDSFYLENKPNKTKYILSIALYFFFFYIFSVIVQLVFTPIWLAIHHIDPNELIEGSAIYNKYLTNALAWTNFLTYVGACGTLIPIFFPIIKKDIKTFGQNQAFYWKWTGLGILIMYGGIIISGIIVSILTFWIDTGGTSENQEVINTIMKSGGLNLVLISIMTVILAPILEELIFRKALFGLFKHNTLKTVIISSIIFASIHVVPACLTILLEIVTKDAKWIDLYTEFVYIFSYLGQAFAISYVYHKSNGNIIPSILIHFVNNFISLIMNLLLMYSGSL